MNSRPSPKTVTVRNLKRCVTIMQQITAKDAALLQEMADMRETAARLRNLTGKGCEATGQGRKGPTGTNGGLRSLLTRGGSKMGSRVD